MAYTLNYSYIEADNAYSVVGCSGTLGNAEIPSTYNDGTHGELPVMRIGNNAFWYKSSLTRITIPESIISIGTSAFSYCNNLTDIYYSGTASQWASIDGLSTLMDYTSASSTAIRTLHIKGELVTTVDLENINEIKSNAFRYCIDITSIKIGNSVTSIGGSAFYGCNRATSLTIGNGITSIGLSAFTYCSNLNSITINAINPPTLRSNVFENTNDCPIYVHRQSVNAYKTSWSEYADRIQEMPHKAVDFESLITYDTNIKQFISEHGGAVASVNGKTGVVVLSAQDVGALSDDTKYGASIEFVVDTTTFELTARLKDQDGNVLGTAQTVDLPLESVVVNGRYDSATKKVVLTLQNGSTIEFSVADLVSGLQTQITAQNKLNADYVNDASSTNKFVTSTEKTAISEAIKYSYQSMTDAQREQARKNIRAIGFITLSPSTTFQNFLLTYRNTAYYVMFNDEVDYVYYTVFVSNSDNGYYFEIESTSSRVRYAGTNTGNLTFAQAMSSTYRQDYALTSEIITSLSRLTQDSTHRTVTDAQIATWNAKQNSPVVKTGTTAPTSSTVADFVGQFYLNTVYGDLFQCTAISNGTYTWQEVGGGGGGGTPIYKHKLHITVNGSMVQEIWGHYYSTDDENTPYTAEEFAGNGDKKFDVDYLKCDSVDGMLYANGGKISTSDEPSIGAVQFTIQNAVLVANNNGSLSLKTTYASYMFGYPDYGTFVEAISVDDTVEEI